MVGDNGLLNIDFDRTVKNAYKLLNKYNDLVLLSHTDYSPKVTASYTLEMHSQTNKVSKQVEDMVMLHVDAENEVSCIVKAINKLDTENRRRLYDAFVQTDLNRTDVMIKYGESRKSYYRKLKVAVYKFALAYQGSERLIEQTDDITS